MKIYCFFRVFEILYEDNFNGQDIKRPGKYCFLQSWCSHFFEVLSMFFQCFYENSEDLCTEDDLTHCFDFGVAGIYLKCCYALLV